MTTKQYLSQMSNIDRRIKDKLNEADRWMDIAYSRSRGKSKQIKHDVIQCSHDTNDKIADAIASSIDYYNEAMQLSESMVQKKHDIENQISSIVDDNHYNILHAYYVDEKSLQEISDEEHYSKKTAKRRFENAIEHFEHLYGYLYLDF